MTPVLRFAPPLGKRLHVGTARIGLANWLYARKRRGRLFLRLDDTDTARDTEAAAAAIREDLAWLGLDWDETIRQSDRLDLYAAAAERLKAAGRLYPCFESEAELQARRDQRVKRGRSPVYDRAMLRMTAEQRARAEAGGKRPYWRFLLSDATREWHDQVLGRCHVKLPTLSDPVLIRADGTPLHALTSVVDDLALGVTDVVRGEDHVTPTGVQLDLIAALGGDPARLRFAHLPALGIAGGRRGGRDELTLRTLRQDGIEPEAVTAYLASLSPHATPAGLPELAAAFGFAGISPKAARFDIAALLRLNRAVLAGTGFAAAAPRLPPGASEAFWLAVRGRLDLLSEAREYWEVVTGEIIPPVIDGAAGLLRQALALLPAEPWTATVWPTWIAALGEATGQDHATLADTLRLALTGEEDGPDMDGLLPLIGRARVARRLSAG
jgi:glutamyl-tRNA synthetase